MLLEEGLELGVLKTIGRIVWLLRSAKKKVLDVAAD